MRTRRIVLAFLLAAGPAAAADRTEEDLLFARQLVTRGLTDMADKVLDGLIASGQPDAVRAGHYGKALATKQQATLARNKLLQDVEEGNPPRVTREDVVKLYEAAKPRIEEYVAQRKDAAGEAAFLLAELLEEYAEFLTGSEEAYDALPDERAKLVDANKDKAAQLFEQAVENYRRVFDEGKDKIAKDDQSSAAYVQVTEAEYRKAIARFRWACIYPKGAQFIHNIETAEEELDTFLNRHYEELFGGYAMLHLGICSYERMIRLGDEGAGQTALDYFSTLYTEVNEDPTNPATSDVVARAFWWYARTANALALQKGALKKAQPIFFENAIRCGQELPQKVKHGIRNHPALLTRLEIADAYAARGDYNSAVSIAGDALTAARAEGNRRIDRLVTAKLTDWVASLTASGTIAPGLLFQIGESLNAQNRTANAITFYEKAISGSVTEEDKDKFARNAALRIAEAYRKDRRPYASALVAWRLVEDYLASGQDEDSPFHQTASEACATARNAWKTISEATKNPADEAQYKKVLETFRSKFPGHPDNSDADFANALDVYSKGRFEEAAKLFREINPASANYWRAQRLVPDCYRQLAFQDTANAAKWHEQALTDARALIQLAVSKGSDPSAMKTKQHGELNAVLALASLQRWEETIQAVDAYLAAYPDDFPKRGLEIKAKIDGHLALSQLDEAEAALRVLKQKQAGSPYRRAANRDVFFALKKKYKEMATGKTRTETALRAADLWQEEVEAQTNPDQAYSYQLGDVLMDAERFEDAAGAFEQAAASTKDPQQASGYTLLAARAQFKAILKAKDMPPPERIKALEKTRQLFTDFLIPDAAKRDGILKKLADPGGWPSKEEWGLVKRRAEELLTAAEVYGETSPPGGLDGRWIGIRLLQHQQSFTKARHDPENPALDEFIPLWWEGAELMLKLYVSIAESGGEPAKAAKSKGTQWANKLLVEYPDMDGQERVERVRVYAGRLK
jgi:hypothetical protein